MPTLKIDAIGVESVSPSTDVTVTAGASQEIIVRTANNVDVSGMDNDLPIEWTTGSGSSTMYTTAAASSFNKTGSVDISSEAGLSNAVGELAETTTLTPINAYSSTNGSYAAFYYTFDTSSVPSDAQNIKLTCVVKAKTENYSQSSERLKFQLAVGSTLIGTAYDFKDLGNNNLTLQTITSDTEVTYADLANLRLSGEIGYYGGGVAGISLTVSYDSDAPAYSYTISNIQEDHNLTIFTESALAIKKGGRWKEVIEVYKKVNGAWVLQTPSSIPGLFATKRYKKMSSHVNLDLEQTGSWIDSGTAISGCTVYKSNGSYQVDNAKDVARITIRGYTTLKLYIRSYAESNYDYTEAFEVNTTAVRGSGKYTTRGKQSTTNYTECIYTLDPGVESFIDVMYSKDGSTSSNDDRGYFYFTVE